MNQAWLRIDVTGVRQNGREVTIDLATREAQGRSNHHSIGAIDRKLRVYQRYPRASL